MWLPVPFNTPAVSHYHWIWIVTLTKLKIVCHCFFLCKVKMEVEPSTISIRRTKWVNTHNVLSTLDGLQGLALILSHCHLLTFIYPAYSTWTYTVLVEAHVRICIFKRITLTFHVILTCKTLGLPQLKKPSLIFQGKNHLFIHFHKH